MPRERQEEIKVRLIFLYILEKNSKIQVNMTFSKPLLSSPDSIERTTVDQSISVGYKSKLLEHCVIDYATLTVCSTQVFSFMQNSLPTGRAVMCYSIIKTRA